MSPNAFFLSPGRAAALAAAVLLSACAGMDADECRDTDWQYLGQLDAMDGKKDLRSRALSHERSCRKQGVAVDLRAYQRGWMQGLRTFCTPENGQAFAEQGGRFQPGYCPPALEGAFLDGYTPARDRIEARQAITELERKIDDKKKEIRAERAGASASRMAFLQADLRDMQQELRQLQARLR